MNRVNLKEHCIVITGNKEIRKKIMGMLWDKYYYEQKQKEYREYEKHSFRCAGKT